jgi:hypothetical protein
VERLSGRVSVERVFTLFVSVSASLGWAVEDEGFVSGGVAEDHVLAWGLYSELFYFGFRELETIGCSLPNVGSILEFENI